MTILHQISALAAQIDRARGVVPAPRRTAALDLLALAATTGNARYVQSARTVLDG